MNKDRRKRIEAIIADLQQIQSEEQEAFDNSPPSIQDGERGQAMDEAIAVMDSAIADLESIIQ